MKYAQLAQKYRLDGRYHLALSSAKMSTTVFGRLEECRALAWLAQYEQAQNRLNGLTRPNGPVRIDYDHAVIICAINLGYWARCRQLIPVLEASLEENNQLGSQIRLHQLLALLCSIIDDNGRGLPHAELALDLAESLGDVRLICDSLFGHADVLHRAQRYAEAAAVWSRCIDQQNTILRSDHPELALSLDGFALSLRQLNQPNAAIPLHLKAQTIYHAELPHFHPALGASYHGLSQALLRCGQVHQAVRHMRLALQCAEHNLPADHPDIAITAFELGRAELSIGLKDAGFKRMQSAHQTGAAILGAEHPMVKRMNDWLSQISGASVEASSLESDSTNTDSSSET